MTVLPYNITDVFNSIGVNGADARPYMNLLRSAVGDDPAVLGCMAQCWHVLNAAAEAKQLYQGVSALRAKQILFGLLCLRWMSADFWVDLLDNRQLLNNDFFEKYADPDVFGSDYNSDETENLSLFMQGFYNLIADTGHVITAQHMELMRQMLDVIAADDACIVKQQAAAKLPRYYRRLNRQAVKQANAQLKALFPNCLLRVFQQDYDERGIVAYNTTLYHDFVAPDYDFVLDCRLETDLATQTSEIALVFFSRKSKARFASSFGEKTFLSAMDFAYYADTPNGPCWIRRKAAGLNAGNFNVLADAVVSEVRAVMSHLVG